MTIKKTELPFLRRAFALLAALALPLVCLAAPAAKQQPLHWVGCGITKTAFMSQLSAAYTAKTGIPIEIEGGGATRGIRDVAAGRADMGGACRRALEDDPQEQGVKMVPVAWDALVAIVNPANSVTQITSDQLREIYRGKITRWNQVGGPDSPIHLYVRKSPISGVGLSLRYYLFHNHSEVFVTRPEYVKPSSGPLEVAVEQDPLALGVTGIDSARKRQVKVLMLNGVKPTPDNLLAGKYEYYRLLYLTVPTNPSPAVAEFVKFTQSADGREILRSQGSIPYRDAIRLFSRMMQYGWEFN